MDALTEVGAYVGMGGGGFIPVFEPYDAIKARWEAASDSEPVEWLGRDNQKRVIRFVSEKSAIVVINECHPEPVAPGMKFPDFHGQPQL